MGGSYQEGNKQCATVRCCTGSPTPLRVEAADKAGPPPPLGSAYTAWQGVAGEQRDRPHAWQAHTLSLVTLAYGPSGYGRHLDPNTTRGSSLMLPSSEHYQMQAPRC